MRNDLEDLLNRYRPGKPPPDLRARILDDAVPSRAWPWAAAAAALVACTLGLRFAGGAEINDVRQSPPDVTALAVSQLAEVLGGTEDARRAADVIVAQEQVRAAHAAQGENR